MVMQFIYPESSLVSPADWLSFLVSSIYFRQKESVNSYLIDVTLAADYNQKGKAHKVILSSPDPEEGGVLPILKKKEM